MLGILIILVEAGPFLKLVYSIYIIMSRMKCSYLGLLLAYNSNYMFLLLQIPLRNWTSKAGLGSAEESSIKLPVDKRSRKWVKAQERFFQLSLEKEPF